MNIRFWRLPLTFDAAGLQADLARLTASDWHAHFNTGYHDGGWSGMALVSADGDAARLYADAAAGSTGIATPWLVLCPAMRAAVAALPAAVQSARLLRLAPGSVIREHRDFGLGLADGVVRIHIPVVSHPLVEFYLDGVRVPMAEGECWYLDLGLPHRVQNHSPRERVHLVVDCLVDERFLALLPSVDDSERQVHELAAASGQTSQQRFEQFRELVLADPLLQSRLQAFEEVDPFIDEVVRAGRQHDLRFTAEDVRAALQAGRRAWFQRHAAIG
jgi:hypothetical protein